MPYAEPFETIETDAMTAVEIREKLAQIAALLGEKSHVSLIVNGNADRNLAAAVLASSDWPTCDSKHFHAATLPEALSAALVWAQMQPAVDRNNNIRRMALAIIGLTDEHGHCTENMLLRQDFGRDLIRELHAVACERAGEMCQGAPFSVRFS